MEPRHKVQVLFDGEKDPIWVDEKFINKECFAVNEEVSVKWGKASYGAKIVSILELTPSPAPSPHPEVQPPELEAEEPEPETGSSSSDYQPQLDCCRESELLSLEVPARLENNPPATAADLKKLCDMMQSMNNQWMKKFQVRQNTDIPCFLD